MRLERDIQRTQRMCAQNSHTISSNSSKTIHEHTKEQFAFKQSLQVDFPDNRLEKEVLVFYTR